MLQQACCNSDRDMGLAISRLRSNSVSGCEAAGLDELQHLTLSDLEECAASAEQTTAAALPSLCIWERRHGVSEIFTRATHLTTPYQPGSTATERAKACLCVLWSLVGLICVVGLLVSAPSGSSPSRSPIWFQPETLVTEAKALNTLRVSLSYQEARLRDAILKKLIDNDATFYGASWCGVTKKQLAELKITETDTRGLDYVDCEREDELCASKGVDAYPTWQINGQKYTGYHPLDKLAELLTEKQ